MLYWFNGCGGLGVDELIYDKISKEKEEDGEGGGITTEL